MPTETLICRTCHEEFDFFEGKPGYRNQCTLCACDVAKVGGNMVWSHKTAPELEIKPMKEARRFAAQTRRLGAGVIRSITERKTTFEEDRYNSLTNMVGSDNAYAIMFKTGK